ncbi:MAG: calcium-transporting P-type ATPase, PMR1-type [Candidatus Micrarchaeota archaeon]|nr:calcium-transporting P-type ATPase, PMR1-type [Candidatus Micrarchaeota archaeon]
MGLWHSYSIRKVFAELKTSKSGISEREAQRRLAKHGKNEIKEMKKDPWFVLFLKQFSSLPILLLLVAALISLILGLTIDDKKLLDAVAILVAVLIAVTFSFIQEYRAEKAIEALKKLVVMRSIVVRGGKETVIDSSHLVPGDIVVLEEGSRVPADIRIFEATTNLAAEQSALTGESVPSAKTEKVLPQSTPVSDQQNMLFAGTTIVRGNCKGIVVETGMNTEFGKIASYVGKEKEKEVKLQKDINELSKKLGLAGIFFAALFFAIGILRGQSIVDMFVVAVTLAVAVIPEGLPTVLAITLALGVQRMAKENAIVRKMPAVETLGSATVICTDKTGTLTQNKITVDTLVLAEEKIDLHLHARAPHSHALTKAIQAMVLCNRAVEAKSKNESVFIGDPTETALLSAAKKLGVSVSKIRKAYKLVQELPFDSHRKMMSVIYLFGKEKMLFTKGAPENVISRSKYILGPSGKEAQFTQKEKQKFLSLVHEFGNEGKRVLAFAYRPISNIKKYTHSICEQDLVFVGIASMEDPPRQEAAEAISLCKSAGIRVVMVTGDSLSTAKAIAKKVGLLEKDDLAIDGSQLDSMSESQFRKVVSKAAVFARVNPEQKYKIVSTLMSMGHIVAVTGDGVNDAPAIKKAHIGVAMGLSGTDVTKEVADIVLTDDNFYSIVNAVRYGRTIFNNIKAFVRYQISTNVAALSLMFSAPALSLPLPLFPLQLLWINIMIDGPPALALGAEPPSHDEMKRPPRNPKTPFLTKNLVISILMLGLLMAAISISFFWFYLSYSPQKAHTAVFTLFVFLQLANALNCRSASKSIFERFFANSYLYLAILVSLALHLAIIYVEPFSSIFKTVPLDPDDFLLIAIATSILVVFEELKKKFFKSLTAY